MSFPRAGVTRPANFGRVLLAIVIALGLIVAAGAVVQVALPRLAAGRIERRLTAGGGSAEVAVSALPAIRLLRNQGDSLVVRGSGLTIGLGADAEQPTAGLRALDGFDAVDVEMVGLRAGPFDVAAFVLARDRSGPYAMAAEGTVTGAELARLGHAWLRSSIPGVGLIGMVVPGVPLGSRAVRIAMEIELHSEPDGLRVGGGGGTIAGYPAGPIATVIAAAVARRLEIAP